VQVDEIWDLDGESLKRLQYVFREVCLTSRQQGKVYGIVFLFKYSSPSGESANLASRGAVDHDLAEQIFFAQQVKRVWNEF
jgi:hypothetical protein